MKPFWVCIAVVVIVLLLARTLSGGDWLACGMAAYSMSPPPLSWLMGAMGTAFCPGRFRTPQSDPTTPPTHGG